MQDNSAIKLKPKDPAYIKKERSQLHKQLYSLKPGKVLEILGVEGNKTECWFATVVKNIPESKRFDVNYFMVGEDFNKVRSLRSLHPKVIPSIKSANQ